MYAPIYFPPADPVSAPERAALLAAERAILAAEGPHHVGGRYVADARLAADLRRTEAERIVAAARRLVALFTPIATVQLPAALPAVTLPVHLDARRAA